jgi:hypothetical protein
MSAGRFAHAFRNSIGLAPHRYVIERRIELAKRLLLETNPPIANLATRAGFSTHAHFCVTFHRMVGLDAGSVSPLRPSSSRRGAPGPLIQHALEIHSRNPKPRRRKLAHSFGTPQRDHDEPTQWSARRVSSQ